MEKTIITIHTDGGSRGNPGIAASAFVVEADDKEIHRGSKFLGKTTNNQAEYMGVLLALDWLKDNYKPEKISIVNFVLDSELVVKQINGLYRVKDLNIKKVFDEVMNKMKLLGLKITFAHVRREQNKIADYLVNEELDKNS